MKQVYRKVQNYRAKLKRQHRARSTVIAVGCPAGLNVCFVNLFHRFLFVLVGGVLLAVEPQGALRGVMESLFKLTLIACVVQSAESHIPNRSGKTTM